MTLWRARSLSRVAALVAVFALVTATAALPAVAVVDTSFSCPAGMDSAGFVDVAGHDAATRRAVDCLAVHDITKGAGPTTFNPGGTVPRWQMALFLVRQAKAHGATIPTAVDQGFTDLGGLSAEARTAINQLAQLGITLGTGPDTFSPHQDVTRWQMALFITRLLAATGIAIPGAADQGFADLGGVSTQARNAIDQLAMLGIANGTSATTFGPANLTLRWQMALFLTRALAVGGVLPPGTQAIDVSPSTHAFLDFQGSVVSRQYTVTVSMDGPFTIELWPASVIRTNGTFEAATAGAIANCDITLVDGSAVSADKVTDIDPTGAQLTFSVGCTGDQDRIVPVVYTGTALAGLTGATSTNALAPTNDGVGIGGGITVSSEAAAGAFGPIAVHAVNKADGSFVSGGVTYFWDANDTFKIGGTVVTQATWEAALTTGDDLLAGSVYDPDPNGTSVFDLQDDSPVAPGLSLASVTPTTATLTYVAAPGSTHVSLYSCQGTGCATTLVRTVVAGTDDDPSTAGTQLVVTGLSPATDYDFQATQTEDVDVSEKSTPVDVDTPVDFSITAVEVQDVNDGDGGWQYLLVHFDDDVAMDGGALLSDFTVHVASQPGSPFSAQMTPTVPFGTTNQLLFDFGYHADAADDIDWILTIAAGALDVGAGGDPNGELTFAFSH